VRQRKKDTCASYRRSSELAGARFHGEHATKIGAKLRA